MYVNVIHRSARSHNVCTSSAILTAEYQSTPRKRYLGLQVTRLILIKFGFSRQILIQCTNTKFHGNPSSGSRDHTCGDGRRQSDRMKVTDALSDYMNASTNGAGRREKVQYEDVHQLTLLPRY